MQGKELNRCFAKVFAVASITLMSSLALADKNEVIICHYPPSGDAPSTISVAASSVPAHLAHGDVEGACPEQAQADAPATVNEPEAQSDGTAIASESASASEPDAELVIEPDTELAAEPEPELGTVAEISAEPATKPEVATNEEVAEQIDSPDSQGQVVENTMPVESEGEIAVVVDVNGEHSAGRSHLSKNMRSLTQEELSEQLVLFMMSANEGGCSQIPQGNSSSTFLVLLLATAFLFFRKRTQVVKQ